ncbi:hypothetical protein BCR33DRAFT_719508 [Rhizoclosmatium globosum]|uniref:Uncharacterized protein n=1 Tax=Rhizoclosmatium globosum TaxID=329046 RepID=A0A1Y2BZN7_9FUNG|nr:hypothetical protein BCR33DRAFT_719508 [Rhizoclosmatium globosum]|eukprot:ORY40097.1 hypothetical protein BCR33DRAFT_719508 [Rhizoclosmatium globosum]
MPYTWGYKSSLADSDIPVSKAFIAAYSNFIYGNAPDTGGIGFTWPLFNTRQEVVLVDAKLSGETYVADAPFLAKCEFWKESALLWNAQGKGGQVNSSGDGNPDVGGEVNPDVGGSFATATMTGTQKGFSALASVLLDGFLGCVEFVLSLHPSINSLLWLFFQNPKSFTSGYVRGSKTRLLN